MILKVGYHALPNLTGHIYSLTIRNILQKLLFMHNHGKNPKQSLELNSYPFLTMNTSEITRLLQQDFQSM